MADAPFRISNNDARRLWLWTNGLANPPTGVLDLIALIGRLGFVQIDTIRNVTRAHHHILWSRNQNYREKMLWRELHETRALFEHFTHDASLIPMDYYPMWRRRFRLMGEKVMANKWYRSDLTPSEVQGIKARIEREGPLSTHAFDSKIKGKKAMWARPPHKKVLDQLWYGGELATSRRENFVKYYDLGERVFPAELRMIEHSDAAQIDYLCAGAMDRLTFANVGEIQRFWGAVDASEARAWVERQTELVPVEIEGADKSVYTAFAPADIAQRLIDASAPSSRMRIVNPFDPAIRDRNRLKRLFGFEYRNEMFVPKDKRIWGYYVYPLLEGSRFVGRIELKADRAKGEMRVTGFWSEPGVRWGGGRNNRLQSELDRFARFVGVGAIEWQCRQPR